jgi:hypothetical protein
MSKYIKADDKLYQFYKGAFKGAFLDVGDDNLIRQAYDKDNLKPLTKHGKLLRLSGPDAVEHKGEYLVHPFVEPISGNETPAMETLRNAYANAICIKAITLITDALNFGASPAMHPNASGDLSDLLVVVQDADKKMQDTWKSIYQVSIQNPDKRFVHFYLKRQAKLGDKTYNRGCITTFPLYDELKKGERKFGNISLRNKDRETYLSLMEYIFPGIGEPHRYSRGAQADFGPYFNSLLQTVNAMFENINEVVEKLKEFSVNYDNIVTDLGWYDQLNSFDELVSSVRMWRVAKEETGTPKPQAVVPVTSNFAQPVYQPEEAPTPVTQEGKLDYRAVMARKNMGQVEHATPQVFFDAQGRPFAMGPQGHPVPLQQGGQGYPGRPVQGGPHQARSATPAWATPQQNPQPTFFDAQGRPYMLNAQGQPVPAQVACAPQQMQRQPVMYDQFNRPIQQHQPMGYPHQMQPPMQGWPNQPPQYAAPYGQAPMQPMGMGYPQAPMTPTGF